ncbi:hypothetical protein NQ315_015427 [Exocentrus adspersus]|uniref:Carbonic anhydrase n=1 Tax=Exocentrus adspersus TaxID=1586481 RepID=A0AAV8VM40_9CUCU|nr:hypothetical protein NQ315_015427 [Exocentrus adspersus]
MTAASLICFIVASVAAGIVTTSSWTYQDQKHWSPQCQEGRLQSPVALSLGVAKEKEFHHFRLSGYGRVVPAVLKNNGHSAEVRLNISQNERPEISGGGLSGIYQLDHLHFHWQSEHVMEDYRFPLELHLVHYAKDTGSLANAINLPGGVAVFAVMFELSPDDDEEFEPLLTIIEKLQTSVGTPMALQHLVVKHFLPRDLAGFYRYEGSLTTPDCNEGILWTIFTNTIPISANQVKIFEEMQTDHHEVLRKNYRSLQPLNGREVSVKISPIRSSAKTTAASSVLLLTIIILTFSNV